MSLEDLGALMATLEQTTAKIQQIITKQGLGNELEWQTDHRKVTSDHKSEFNEFFSRAAKFQTKMQKENPGFLLTDYWAAMDAKDSVKK